MTTRLASCVAALVLAVTAPLASGQAIPIANASFESPVLAEGAGTNGGVPGWSPNTCTTSCWGAFNPAVGGVGFPDGSVPDGANALYMIQQVSQTLVGYTLQANTRYTLDIAVGNPADRPDAQFFGFSLGTEGGGAVMSYSAPLSSLSASNGSFIRLSIDATVLPGHADIGKTLRVNLEGPVSSGPRLQYIAFDDVHLVASAVPESGTLALFAAGLGLLVARHRRAR